ncbi:carbohydrate ABC transporter permease [Paenibacillus thalictri]|uniref:Carbohydrate ABC transporter permease n=1 Tax=Paenibacillus thalictri TaxID=2527873 RepID=A0A4V2J4T7_9BACL|nr:carbohydrate ABC transporter permease [Paenibacillus thalictri]TBL80882.1 carbohydrate ABC transporter permease [Paenibacillus thalictri]
MLEHSRRDAWFHTGNYAVLTLLALVFVLPFYTLLMTSFVSEAERMERGALILFPHRLDMSAYMILLKSGSSVYKAYGVTLFRIVVGTTLNLVLTAMLAYGLSKKTLPFRNAIAMFIFFTMIFSGGLIPNYLLNTLLGLKDSVWVLILPVLVSAYNFFIMRTFFQALPAELEESAFIDGAQPFTILWKIIVPVSLPSFVTIGLFYAVFHWNSWFDAALYINDAHKLPIQMVLRNILLTSTVDDPGAYADGKLPPMETIKAAMTMIATIPILIVYPFVQKFFVKGAMIGAVKG